jgi:hypothetical protein
MAHWAKVENGIVTQVTVGDNNDPAGDEGLSWLQNNLGGTWVKTSYNTRGGIHYGDDGIPDNGKPLRKNYAGIGHTYDSTRDAFYEPSPFLSWVLNEDTCIWEAPIPYPTDGLLYHWDEPSKSWVESPPPPPIS